MRFWSHSIEETLAFGRRLGAAAPAGLCIALDGPLGAGKTHLGRGIAAGAGVANPDLVSSPTFVLLNIYPENPVNPCSKAVYHLDAYRAHSAEDFESVGFEELLHESGLVVVEWAARVPGLLPEDHLAIAIEVEDEMGRGFTITATGPRGAGVIRVLENS